MSTTLATFNNKLPCKYVKQYLIGDKVTHTYNGITITTNYSVYDFLTYLQYLAHPPKPDTLRFVWLNIGAGDIKDYYAKRD